MLCRVLFASVIAAAAASQAPAQYTFTKIADTATAVPGGADTFDDTFRAPAVSGPTVVFRGADSATGNPGLYATSGGPLAVVANTATPIPGHPGTFFGDFLSPAVSGTTVAFYGFDASATTIGVYARSAGSLGVVADTTTAVPGGPGTFGDLGSPAVSGTTVAFKGFDASFAFSGVYAGSAGGALAAVADRNTPGPSGVGNFSSFLDPAIDGATVVFFGVEGPGTVQGIYAGSAGSITAVAATGTPIPGGGGATFSNFDYYPAVSGGTVAFAGSDGGGVSGVYTASGGSIDEVASTATTVPGEAVTFGGLFSPAVSGTTVAFVGGSPAPGGASTSRRTGGR